MNNIQCELTCNSEFALYLAYIAIWANKQIQGITLLLHLL